MTESSPELTWQQVLAALADRELDGAARRRAEEWLRQHPEAAVDFDAQRTLSPQNQRLWSTIEPPIPSDSRWHEVRAGIERRLAPNAEPSRQRRRNRWLKRGLILAAMVVTGATAAAVVVAALPPNRAVPPNPVTPGLLDDGEDVLAVTRPDDVDIVSIRHADSSRLVVGQPPVRDRLILASAGDVTLDNIQPDSDGNLPVIQMGENEVPAIVVPTREP
jgi:hypothetical protein